MAVSHSRRKDDATPPRETLADLTALLNNGVPEDAVLGRVQSGLEELINSAQLHIKSLDRQLDKITKATTQISQEQRRRTALGQGGANADVEMSTLSSDSADETEARDDAHQAAGSLQLNGASTNDKDVDKQKSFVPNPKSEYVPSQPLPISALRLFEDTPGNENLKHKLAVASYPTKDLQDLLPGPIPDDDFTRAKPLNQVQFPTFAAFLEPYFRPFTEEDIALLQQKSVGNEVVSFGRAISPYTIPPLGPIYTDIWADEDGLSPGYSLSTPPRTANRNRYVPLGSSSNFTDEEVEVEKVAAGPLTARLIAGLLPEDGDDDSELVPSVPPVVTEIQPMPNNSKRLFENFASLEERLRREFLYVGIVDINTLRNDEKKKRQFKLALDMPLDDSNFDQDPEIDWVNCAEDDEVCRELRTLQDKLRHVSSLNQKYKRRLLPYVQEQMAWQEFSSILDDLDKQVDQAYIKRLKMPKAKKKKVAAATPTPLPVNVPSTPRLVDQKPAIRATLDKRHRWINKIGGVFSAPHVMLRGHEVPKFEGDDDEEENEEPEDE